MSEEISQTEPKVAMVIMAHPDDAEFGCAGTIAAWARDGWEIHYVICSDGSGGGSDDAREVGLEARRKISDTRKQEQREAAQVLGARDVVFLDFPDGRLEPTLDLRREIVRVLRRYRPTRVICQSPERTWTPVMAIPRHHPDHLAAGQATLFAIYPASQNPWDFPELLEEGLEPHRVREVYISGAPFLNHVVDISDTIDLKIEALAQHASQHLDFAQTEERIRGWTAANGAKHGLAHAEEYHLTLN